MSRTLKAKLTAAMAVAAVTGACLGNPTAADHNDPPSRVGTNIDAADIADLYAWHSADKLTLVLTFAGPAAPAAGQAGMYDPDVLYGLHIDSNGDHQPDSEIWVRFAQNDLGAWGVQLVGLPGEAGAVQGAVDTELNGAGGAKVWTGLRDDPFFFDLQGFTDTLNTGALSFMSTRDSFEGLNATAVVIEVPLAAALAGGTNLSLWATSSRI